MSKILYSNKKCGVPCNPCGSGAYDYGINSCICLPLFYRGLYNLVIHEFPFGVKKEDSFYFFNIDSFSLKKQS